MKYEIFKLRGLEMKKKKKAVLNLINTNILLLQANFNDVYLHFQVPRFLLKDSLGKLMNFL